MKIIELTARVKIFYEDQRTRRESWQNEETNFEIAEEQQKKTEAEQEMVEAEALEKLINPPEYQEIISITPV